MFCSNCGEENNDNAKFCKNCGTIIYSNAEYDEETSDNIDSIKKCPKCGAELDSDHIFCVNCGTNLNEYNNINYSEPIENEVSEENLNKNTEKYDETTQNTNVVNGNDINVIISNIKFDRLIVYSVLSLVVAVILSVIFLYLLAASTSYANIPYYPIAFYMGIAISVGIFAAFPKDMIEAGILGFIVGLVIILFENTIVSLVFNSFFAYIYNVGYSGHSVGYLIIGIIVAILTQLYLKDSVKSYINLENFF